MNSSQYNFQINIIYFPLILVTIAHKLVFIIYIYNNFI